MKSHNRPRKFDHDIFRVFRPLREHPDLESTIQIQIQAQPNQINTYLGEDSQIQSLINQKTVAIMGEQIQNA